MEIDFKFRSHRIFLFYSNIDRDTMTTSKVSKYKKLDDPQNDKSTENKHSLNDSWDSIGFWITFTVSFFVYQTTVAPSISGGDAGELVAEGCKLGTAHPPGYPLYVIIVFIVTTLGEFLLPVDYSKAWMVNTTSCIFGSFASAFLTSSILSILRGKAKRKFSHNHRNIIDIVAAVTMGLLHSSSSITWQYSTTAEVFALHNLFVALIVHSTVQYEVKPSLATYLKGAFVCGFALTNQHTSILLSLPLILWVLSVTRLYTPNQLSAVAANGQTMYLILLASGTFLSSIIVFYGTLPFFSLFYHHAGSWGDVTSLSGLINHIRRKDYGTLRLFSGNDTDSEGFLERIFLWAKDFVFHQGKPFVAICFVVGCREVVRAEQVRRSAKSRFQSTRRSAVKRDTITGFCRDLTFEIDGPGVDMAILCSLIFYLLIFHFLSNLPLNSELLFGVHQRFWLHPNLLCFLLAGIGLSSGMNEVNDRFPRTHNFLIFTPIFLVLYALMKGMVVNDQSDNYHFHDYASSILSTLPMNSLLLTSYDQQWTSIRYLQECEGIRNDVTSIHIGMMSYHWWKQKRELYPHIHFPGPYYSRTGSGFSFSQFVEANYDSSNGIFIGGHPSFSDPIYQKEFEEIPHGIVSRVVRKKDEVDMRHELYRRSSKVIWNKVAKEYETHGLPDLSKYGQVTWESTIVREFYDHFASRATHLLHLAVAQVGNKSKIVPSMAEACAWLESVRLNDHFSESLPGLWKNLGIGYMHLVRSKEKNFPTLEELLIRNVTKYFQVDTKIVWWDGESDWKTWASNRWELSWGRFLQMEDAKLDDSYESVKSIYEQVMKLTRRRGTGHVDISS